MTSDLFNTLFPEDSLRRPVALVLGKAFIGTVTPVIAMPYSLDDLYHVAQAILVICISGATLISICLDIARKRREAIDTANRRDREQFFRIKRANKNKHRRHQNEDNS